MTEILKINAHETAGRVRLSAFLKGLLEGFGGPAMMGSNARHDITILISYETNADHFECKHSVRSNVADVLGEFNSKLHDFMMDNSLSLSEGVEWRLDKHGKLRERKLSRVRRADVKASEQSSK